MGQRIPCTSQMIDFEMRQQGHRYVHPDPSILLRETANFQQPSIHTLVPGSGNTNNPDAQNHGMFYGMIRNNGVQNHHGLDLNVATPGNFYYSYPSGSGMLPVPLNHAVAEQLPSSRNYGVTGVSGDDYGRNTYFMDEFRCPYKRKIAEGIPGNIQYFNGSTSSSSSGPPLNTGHPNGVAASFSLPLYRWSGTSTIDMGPTNRSGENDHTGLTIGNYSGPPLQSGGNFWLDQHLTGNSADEGASSWNQVSAMPYLQGSNANRGSFETANMGVQRYLETASTRNSIGFQHPHINRPHHNYHHPLSTVQGARGHNFNFHPQAAATSYRYPSNPSRSTMNPSHNGFELGRSLQVPVSSTGLRIYWPHRGAVVAESTLRHQNLPHLRVLRTDEVALLEIPDFYEVGSLVDHHRDMRLDIEDMSYEELLALGERIGNVSTGLSEEIIASHLKTRNYVSSAAVINLEESPSMDQENASCIICQDIYQDHEKIGILNCGHEYHADCLKKWLLIKNTCPICKSEALTTETKDL